MNYELARTIGVVLFDTLSPIGIYPALTGGCLYKQGERKDVDFVIYRNQKIHSGKTPAESLQEAIVAMHAKGFSEIIEYGYVTKMKLGAVEVDILFPEWGDDTSYGEQNTPVLSSAAPRLGVSQLGALL